MLILGFILGIIATVGLIFLIRGQTAASSSSGTHYASSQSVRLGAAASSHTEWQPVRLHTRLDVETPAGHLTYKSSGPPDAVLYGNEQFLTALRPSLSPQPGGYALPGSTYHGQAITSGQSRPRGHYSGYQHVDDLLWFKE